MRVPAWIVALLCAFPLLTSCQLLRHAPEQPQPEKNADKPPSPSVPKEVLLNARLDAATRLNGGMLDEVAVVSAESVSWPSPALGCPTPGMNYPQEVTPGYQIKLRAGGKIFDYHAGLTGTPLLCPAEIAKPPLAVGTAQPRKSISNQPPRPPSSSANAANRSSGSPPSSMLDSLLVRAKTDAVRRTGTIREDIIVISAEPVSWSDPSLDCPRRGVAYPQVVTPGYQIRLRAGGQMLDYRAASSGSILLCPPELARPPR